MILKVLFNPALNTIYNCSRFSETLLEKGLKFVLGERGGFVLFFSCLVLLPLKVDPISKEQSCKRDAFKAHGPSCFKMVLALLTEVITFHVQVSIVVVGVFSLERSIARCEVYLAMFLVLEK